jgi:aldehyde dehydrogenase (NAD+)
MTNPLIDQLATNEKNADIRSVFERQLAHQYTMAATTARQRIERLQRLYNALLNRRAEVEAAMWADLRKGPTEVGISELGVVLGEIRHVTKHLQSWMYPKRVPTPIAMFGSSSEIQYQPKGVVLIISPWNYPINLTFGPLVTAIAAGNCVILKPSEYTPHCSALMRSIIESCFLQEEVAIFEGDASVSQALLELPLHHIFFTGSPQVGKIVMTAAAKNLTSVTLELGGKSPVIVDETADLDVAAAKVAWTKSMNSGQICIAPDYVLVHASVHDQFIRKVSEKLRQYYGDTPEARQASPDLCRMVSHRQFARVKSLLDDAQQRGAQVAFGGHTDEANKYIEPTVLTQVPNDAKIWEEEIFGTLLAVRTWKSLDEAVGYIQQRPRPLALYLFSRSKSNIKQILQQTHSGGVVVNDCGIQYTNFDLPFGGINNSGIGHGHGEHGFRAFSHERAVVRQTAFMPSTNFLLPPYGGKLAKFLLEGLVKWF